MQRIVEIDSSLTVYQKQLITYVMDLVKDIEAIDSSLITYVIDLVKDIANIEISTHTHHFNIDASYEDEDILQILIISTLMPISISFFNKQTLI